MMKDPRPWQPGVQPRGEAFPYEAAALTAAVDPLEWQALYDVNYA